MASNDSSAANAVTVNAGTPTLPVSQPENKGKETTQTNHNAVPSPSASTETNPVAPDVSDTSSVTPKDIQKTEPVSTPSPAVTSTPNIPSSVTTETKTSASVSSSQPADINLSKSEPKPPEDEGKQLTSGDSSTIKTSADAASANTTESKKEENSEKEQKEPATVPARDEKKTEQQASTPPVACSEVNSDKLQATNESLPSNNNTKSHASDRSADRPSVSESEVKKSDDTQNATPTSSIESPPADGTSAQQKPSTPAPAPSKPVATIKPMVESNAASNDSIIPMDTSASKSNPTGSNPKSNNKRPAEDGEESSSDKKIKSSSTPSSSGGQKEGNKTAKEVFEYMDKTFEQRRKIITKQMPTIPELKSMYPELFMCKQLLLEFQRITKIDIDQKIQEFCVRYATAVIEMARSNKAAAPVLARWEKAKQENETLKQYWDMVTALCLLPLHFGENFVEMVLEIEEDEEVKAQGKIVPTLVARGNIFRTDEFFLIAENTIVQEFEEFTIAFASLYSSYWVFNMVYPETIENTYNYIQRCIVRQREPGAISAVCKNFTKSLQKWNKEKEGK